jgi:hypothetical protein
VLILEDQQVERAALASLDPPHELQVALVGSGGGPCSIVLWLVRFSRPVDGGKVRHRRHRAAAVQGAAFTA